MSLQGQRILDLLLCSFSDWHSETKLSVIHHTLTVLTKPRFALLVTLFWVFVPHAAILFALPVYLLLGLVCVLVVLETCCELPQMKRLRQRFYRENVRELDSETTNIIDRDHLSDQLTDPLDQMHHHHPPVIPSVSQQAASLRQDKSTPYTPVSGPAANGNLR